MPRRKLTTSQRAAIWKAHGKRCVYTSEPLPFGQLHIEHIIPEYLEDMPEELKRLKREHGLSIDFNINGYENLIPTFAHRNLQKGQRTLGKNAALYFISLATSKVPEVIRILKEQEKENKLDDLRISLIFAIEQGKMTFQDVTRLFSELKNTEFVLPVPTGLEFADGYVLDAFTASDAQEMLERPILPRRQGLEFLTMKRREGEFVRIHTCKEWAEAIEQGYFASSTYDIKEEVFFKSVYSVARALLIGSPPDITYIRDPWVGVGSYDNLHVTLLPALSGEDVEEIEKLEKRGATIGSLIRSGVAQVETTAQYSAVYHYTGMGLALWELLRRDLTGDGVEDLLIKTYIWTHKGTFGFGDVVVLSRPNATAHFIYVKK